VVVKFLHVLAVIALAVGEAEEALLQNRVLAVPQRERKAEPALVVAHAGDSVFAPAIRAAASVVVREIIPRVALWRIILAHRAPLALGEIRPPTFPVGQAGFAVSQALCLGVHALLIRSNRL